MKLFRSTSLFIQGILIAGMLSACQNESDTALAPQAPANTSDQNARTAVAAGTLIKDGNTTLAYNSQDPTLLWKESNANTQFVFTYAPQLISAMKFTYGNPAPEYKYFLDTFGRCVQTVTDKTYIYEYNADGQLTKIYNKYQPDERREFSYAVDATGWKKSLSTVKFYDEQGAKTKELTFTYGGATGIPDKHPLNPDVFPAGVSKYLRIFGNFNTNLVQLLIEDKYLPNGQKASSTTHAYSYTLGTMGKAKNITVKKINGTLVSSTDRTYTMPKYNF
ncbi:hypothetical protein LZD49_15500 [Dyadobacter sp. CY261]|uniref:hypothetical protein n=1 Tax=Dyadobacter sp. CY261 TaxID=2907203 RepID=UPI001F39B9F4|nr:hypothetical protein [Dyadobacter sp. CY261]MCF0071882.1 hypothetical protein [Dyadobacter sp. CY261]